MNRTSASSVNSPPTGPSAQQSVSNRSLYNNSSSSNSSRAIGGHRTRRPKFMVVLVVLVVLVALGAGAAPTPNSPAGGTVPPELLSFLERHAKTWMEPCRHQGQTDRLLRANLTTTGNKDNELQMLQHLKGGLELSVDSLNYWRNQSQSSKRDTNWSTEDHMKKFKFLRPFVANVSTWERRLSIYWASLERVITVHDQQSGKIDSHPEVLSAMRVLSEHNRELLCYVQEYGSIVNVPSKQIKLKRMGQTLKSMRFGVIRDVNEIKIDRWYIMCRLDCYLQSMRAHVEWLIQKEAAQQRGARHNCKMCPYSPSKAHKKHPKPTGGRDSAAAGTTQQDRPRKPQPNHTTPQPQKQHKKKKNAGRKQEQSGSKKKSSNGSRKYATGVTGSSSPRPNRQG